MLRVDKIHLMGHDCRRVSARGGTRKYKDRAPNFLDRMLGPIEVAPVAPALVAEKIRKVAVVERLIILYYPSQDAEPEPTSCNVTCPSPVSALSQEALTTVSVQQAAGRGCICHDL